MGYGNIALDIAQSLHDTDRGNDAAADRSLISLAERRADGIDARAGRDRAALDRQGIAVAWIGLDQGDITLLGDADHLGHRLDPVRPTHPHLLFIAHYMGIGQHITI